MNLKFKITAVNEAAHSIVVRYYTDLVTEADLCTYRDAKGNIVQCSSDLGLTLPTDPKLEGDGLRQWILQQAPVHHLRVMESVKDPMVNTDMTAIKAAVGVENLTTLPPAPDDGLSPLDKAKKARKQHVAAWRYGTETGGVTVDGIIVKTDPESQAKISGALVSLKENLVADIQWKGVNGWVTLGLPQMTAVATAVAQHVRQCFIDEKKYLDAIDACTTVDAVNAIVPGQIPVVTP